MIIYQPENNMMTQKDFDTVISKFKALMIGKYEYDARWYISGLARTHTNLVAEVQKGTMSVKELHKTWESAVKDTLDHILSGPFGGMHKKKGVWTVKDAELNDLMKKLTKIHNAIMKNPPNPDRPETLEAAYVRIDELNQQIEDIVHDLYN
jgi:hypothetical protein